jgi:hypothetical protein
MQPRIDAIARLLEHEHHGISAATKSVLDRLRKEIELERLRDKLRDEDREQRFE